MLIVIGPTATAEPGTAGPSIIELVADAVEFWVPTPEVATPVVPNTPPVAAAKGPGAGLEPTTPATAGLGLNPKGLPTGSPSMALGTVLTPAPAVGVVAVATPATGTPAMPGTGDGEACKPPGIAAALDTPGILVPGRAPAVAAVVGKPGMLGAAPVLGTLLTAGVVVTGVTPVPGVVTAAVGATPGMAGLAAAVAGPAIAAVAVGCAGTPGTAAPPGSLPKLGCA